MSKIFFGTILDISDYGLVGYLINLSTILTNNWCRKKITRLFTLIQISKAFLGSVKQNNATVASSHNVDCMHMILISFQVNKQPDTNKETPTAIYSHFL